MYGKKHSPETRRKLSLAGKGKKLAPEVVAKMRLRKLTPALRDALRLVHVGKIVSQETRAKLSKTLKSLPFSEERKNFLRAMVKRSAVLELDPKTGSVINTFESVYHADEQTGIDRTVIYAQCKGKRTKSTRRFMFEEDYLAILSAGAVLPVEIPKAKKKGQKIVQLDRQGHYLNSFGSIREAVSALGIPDHRIERALKVHNVVMDFIFIRKEEYDPSSPNGRRNVPETAVCAREVEPLAAGGV